MNRSHHSDTQPARHVYAARRHYRDLHAMADIIANEKLPGNYLPLPQGAVHLPPKKPFHTPTPYATGGVEFFHVP